MLDHFWGGLVTVITAIIGLAVIATLVSNRAQTAGVISAGSSGLANDISAAVAPVTGSQATINTGSSGFGGFNLQGAGSYSPPI
jgi:hypothetical protein